MSDEEQQKKVLIITYYWPPSGGSGVQRWLKFVKYLPQFGWQPYVFTPENPSFDIKDESLLRDVPIEAEVLHFPIWEPYALFNKLGGGKSGNINANSAPKADSLFKKISIWIRGNFFIPDPRVFWVRPSVAFLDSFLKEKKIRTIITTGPPHSVHLIGLRLKKRNPSLKWIADFRDPWSEWGFLDTLKLGRLARSRHQRLERKVLETASVVLTVTPSWVRSLQRLSKRKVNLLTNGFDEDDFKRISFVKSDNFIIRHVGVVNEQCNPRPFMYAFERWCTENPDIERVARIEFIGEVHPDFQQFVKTNTQLNKNTSFIKNMPHADLLATYGTASLLLLVLTGYKNPHEYLPGKLFEYFATGLPILGIGPVDGDAAQAIKETNTGHMINGDDLDGIIQALNTTFQEWSQSSEAAKRPDVSQYSRRGLTAGLVELLK